MSVNTHKRFSSIGRWPIWRGVFVVWLVATLTFLLMHATQDDVVDMVFSQQQSLSAAMQAEKRAALGLDDSLVTQYVRWWGQLFQGDLGNSLVTGEEVSNIMSRKLSATLVLMVSAIGSTLLIAVPVGLWLACKAGSWQDRFIRGITVLGNTMPNFFTALLLLYVVALQWDLLPVVSRKMDWQSILLPTLTLFWSMSAKYIQQTRALALEELQKPYILGLRSRGLSWFMIMSRYVSLAIAPPLLTLVALSCGSLLGGVTIVESIFMWDGIGKMAFDAITSRDYPVLQAYVLWVSLFYVLLNYGVERWQQYWQKQVLGGQQYEE
ncbi:ABC transporter permease [Veillonella intestinalis]|uniref:ABC transporter permease n=1 Tax=Veillonella intestinalis TaxID=2941341 RepID=UPI00203F2E49|nr:ABC transporter permease [Veillonella intestinalis]